MKWSNIKLSNIKWSNTSEFDRFDRAPTGPATGPAQRRLRFGRSAGPGSRHRARGGPERFALPTKRCDLVARSRAKARSRGPPVGSSESETVRTVLARCLPDPCGPMRPWGTVGEICALASSALGSEYECAVLLQVLWDLRISRASHGAGDGGRALGHAGAVMVAARRRRRSSAAEGSLADMQRLVACRRPVATTRNALEAEGG